MKVSQYSQRVSRNVTYENGMESFVASKDVMSVEDETFTNDRIRKVLLLIVIMVV